MTNLDQLLKLHRGLDPAQPITPNTEVAPTTLADASLNVTPITRPDAPVLAPNGNTVDRRNMDVQATLGLDTKRKTASNPLGTPTPKGGLF
jgi:hypothetical protein